MIMVAPSESSSSSYVLGNYTVDFGQNSQETVSQNSGDFDDLNHLWHLIHIPFYCLSTIITILMYRRYRIQSRPLPSPPGEPVRRSSFEEALLNKDHPIHHRGPLYLEPLSISEDP